MKQTRPPTALNLLTLSLLIAGCSAPTPSSTPTADPRPMLETMVASTMQSAAEATAAAATASAAPVIPTASPAPQRPTLSPQEFTAELQRAVAARDTSALVPLMADPFSIALWKSEGQTLPPRDAASRLSTDLLYSHAPISFSTDIPAEAAAVQPQDVKVIQSLLSTGWGADGLGEALLTIVQDASGLPAWHSLVFAPSGFEPPTPAALKGVITVPSANLRSGPGTLHTLLAPYAMGSELIVSYTAPGRTWGKVATADGKEGWMLLSLMKFDASTDALPIFPGLPSDSIHIYGWVEGGSRQPIDKAYVTIWQKEENTTRPQGITDSNGMFHIYLPADSTGTWTIRVDNVDCGSSVMDKECKKQAEFVQLTQTITLPNDKPVVFVYNNILGDTPAQVAQGCPAAEPGKLPLNNSQDGYCLLYPEGFTILQPATNLLEIVGPDLDQTIEALSARVSIQKKPLPQGSSLETVAAALWSTAQPDYIESVITIGGEQGLYADHLQVGDAPARMRQIVVIHQGSYYILTFTPYDQADPFNKAMPDQQKAWDTITTSLRFNP